MKDVAWLDTRSAAAHMGFRTVSAFHKWLQGERKSGRTRVKVYWLGNKMRFREANLDACMEPEPAAAR